MVESQGTKWIIYLIILPNNIKDRKSLHDNRNQHKIKVSFYGNKTSVETHFYLVSGEKRECLNNETGWMVLLLLNIDSSRSSSLKEGEKSGTLHQIFRECRIEFNIKNGLKVHLQYLFFFLVEMKKVS